MGAQRLIKYHHLANLHVALRITELSNPQKADFNRVRKHIRAYINAFHFRYDLPLSPIERELLQFSQRQRSTIPDGAISYVASILKELEAMDDD